MSDDSVPVAVVGAGSMGANHIRVYDELPNVELVEVVEPDETVSGEIEDKYDVEVLNDLDEISKSEAATVAVPTEQHRYVAEELISRGIDVLVEKPIALSVQDARQIVKAAEEKDVVLQVGHIERFNPAVITLNDLLGDQELISIEAHRLGPFNEQLSDECVVFDLMIHDIDIIRMLAGSETRNVDAVGTKRLSDTNDHAVALFEFESGVVGTATASHVTHGKIRTLKVTTKEAYIELDYQKQNLTIQRRGTEKTTRLLNQSGYVSETITETPYIKTKEPLKNELEHFIGCVIDRTKPEADGEVGLDSVKTAARIVDSISG